MRTFVDEQGTEWTAWEVRPGVGSLARPERRAQDRRREQAPEPVVERRRGPDRRTRASRSRTALVPRMEAWLAFQAGTVRRRLVPIPGAWDAMTDEQLRALCRTAAPVARAMVAVD
jgi:hypothetical protein